MIKASLHQKLFQYCLWWQLWPTQTNIKLWNLSDKSTLEKTFWPVETAVSWKLHLLVTLNLAGKTDCLRMPVWKDYRYLFFAFISVFSDRFHCKSGHRCDKIPLVLCQRENGMNLRNWDWDQGPYARIYAHLSFGWGPQALRQTSCGHISGHKAQGPSLNSHLIMPFFEFILM